MLKIYVKDGYLGLPPFKEPEPQKQESDSEPKEEFSKWTWLKGLKSMAKVELLYVRPLFREKQEQEQEQD